MSAWCPHKETEIWTQGETGRGTMDTDRTDGATTVGTPRLASGTQKLGRERPEAHCPSVSPEGTSHGHTVSSDICSPELTPKALLISLKTPRVWSFVTEPQDTGGINTHSTVESEFISKGFVVLRDSCTCRLQRVSPGSLFSFQHVYSRQRSSPTHAHTHTQNIRKPTQRSSTMR